MLRRVTVQESGAFMIRLKRCQIITRSLSQSSQASQPHQHPPSAPLPIIPVARSAGSELFASLRPVPLVPKILGLSGLIPFVSTTAVSVLMPQYAAHALSIESTYGCCILSFMGAIHWTLAMQQDRASAYVISVLPSLLAFFSTFGPIETALGVQGLGFAALLGYDALRRKSLPPWYLSLRVWLTGVVCTCLAASAAFAHYSVPPSASTNGSDSSPSSNARESSSE